ncbi:MAG: 3-isopropylmalate dehydratase small subunit [bacterium]|nr:3-isopropylmalate dehydratase small subunit [bacterium]
MEDTKITTITGRAFHLPGEDIDTDRIIPARFLRCVTFDGLGEHVFEDDRKQRNGDHPFDQPDNKGCEILIADVNFGCGSSREHAVAAIQRWGIKAIIARSFAAIFRGNSTANGLVCVDVDESVHKQLLDFRDEPLTINLESLIIYNDRYRFARPCTMPSADRDMLTTGTWDTTATLLQAGDQIEATASRLAYMQPA